jgi:hypothetical protein
MESGDVKDSRNGTEVKIQVSRKSNQIVLAVKISYSVAHDVQWGRYP